MGKVHRVTVLCEDSNKVVNFLLNVVLCVDDLSGFVMKMSHYTSILTEF